MELTTLERRVFVALFDSAKGNSHDFGFIEDARASVDSADQLGGVIASLVKKRYIEVHDPITTNRGTSEQATYTQFTWCDAEKVMAYYLGVGTQAHPDDTKQPGMTNGQITGAINKAMKKAGRYNKWKFSHVGTFIAIRAQDDTKVGDAYACMKWFQCNFPSLIGKNMVPVITSNIDGVTLINFSAV